MKRVVKGLMVTALTLGAMGGSASAVTTASSCTIMNTGNASVNSCVDTTNDTTTFFCTNNATITSANAQTATSGTANVSGNGSGGSAVSGNTDNTVLNNVAVELGCGSVAVANPAPTAPTAPAGGQGGAAPAPAAPVTAPVAVKALPNTGENNVLTTAAISAAVLGSVAVVSQLALSAYRRGSN